VLRLHYENLPQNEIERINGIPVTTALRAILDLWLSEEIPRDILRKALKEGTRLGRIDRRHLRAASRNRIWRQALAEITEGSAV
jgi:hypothetical protein